MRFRCKIIIFFLCILALLPYSQLLAQIEISKPRIEVVDDKMIISYEISGNSAEDTITVSLNVTDSLGNKIEPKALEGDIGKNIGAGTEKKIIWDLKIDSFYVNMNIYIGIVADVIIPPEIIPMKDEETPEEITKQEDTESDHELIDSSLINENQVIAVADDLTGIKTTASVGKIAMLSAIFPGWGLTKLSHKKPYWLLGVAGAGCIAGSIYFNHQAYSNYEKYTETDNLKKMNAFYDDAEKQDKISNYLAISALAIWIADIGVASLKAASVNRRARSGRNNITMDYRYDTSSESPMLSLIYKF